MNADVIRTIEILEFRRAPCPVKKKKVFEWLSSGDVDVVAAATGAIVLHPDAINPPLTTVETLQALLRNLALNLGTVKANTVYGYTCYEAGRELLSWLFQTNDSHQTHVNEARIIAEFKVFVGDLYRTATTEQRNCLVNGLLEHVLEKLTVSEAFEDWKSDDVLSEPFKNASLWSDWARTRREVLGIVAEMAAVRVSSSRHVHAFAIVPSVGIVTPTIAWVGGEISLSCDSEFVDLFRMDRIDIDAAARFVASEEHFAHATGIFCVHLIGANFPRGEPP